MFKRPIALSGITAEKKKVNKPLKHINLKVQPISSIINLEEDHNSLSIVSKKVVMQV